MHKFSIDISDVSKDGPFTLKKLYRYLAAAAIISALGAFVAYPLLYPEPEVTDQALFFMMGLAISASIINIFGKKERDTFLKARETFSEKLKRSGFAPTDEESLRVFLLKEKTPAQVTLQKGTQLSQWNAEVEGSEVRFTRVGQ